MKLALVLCIAALAPGALADGPLVLDECAQQRTLLVDAGSTVDVRCEAAVMNRPALEALAREQALFAKVIALYRQGQGVDAKTIDELKLQIARYEQTQSELLAIHDRLRAQTTRLDALATQANENTKETLRIVKRVRLASYLSSGLTGAAAGGLGGLQVKDSGAGFAIGAGVGLVVGVAVNYLLQP